jgi:hypothetical protein
MLEIARSRSQHCGNIVGLTGLKLLQAGTHADNSGTRGQALQYRKLPSICWREDQDACFGPSNMAISYIRSHLN